MLRIQASFYYCLAPWYLLLVLTASLFYASVQLWSGYAAPNTLCLFLSTTQKPSAVRSVRMSAYDLSTSLHALKPSLVFTSSNSQTRVMLVQLWAVNAAGIAKRCLDSIGVTRARSPLRLIGVHHSRFER
ncbi:hypothetical protein K469DRAFT_162305 [Zopfia rhizophila CBS 207.26]|uniref:Uncharacterized protein n=1 Tax=Zopfia rhizophila CBS 207.26 TaxID=1314779 RepID=A0A6A6E4S4_9PEZI|nr:hypothetical protein K469DRAFT_162305 [Zopfia rhizophila CBS 207.26]